MVLQPPGSNMCGQACLAMVLNISIEEACVVVKTRGKTTTRMLVDGLRSMGMKIPDKRVLFRGFDRLPVVAILNGKHRDGSHWVVWADAQPYDPSGSISGLRITSYLPVASKA